MQWRVDRYGAGLTTEEYLLRQIPAVSAGYLRQLFRQQKICRATDPLTPGDILTYGQQLQLPDSQRLLSFIRQAPALNIVDETTQWLILDKPAGLAIHRTGTDEPDLTSLLQALIKRRGEPYRMAPVTRLDRGTSGLVVFAKGRQAAGELGRQVMANSWRKLYLALVRGTPPAQGELDQEVSAKGKIKQARARFRRLHSGAGCALLEVELLTGRTHQIRQQFAACGHPLMGDQRYGFVSSGSSERMFLHCVRLELPVTDSARRLSLTAPLPATLKCQLKALWGKNC